MEMCDQEEKYGNLASGAHRAVQNVLVFCFVT